MELNSEQAEALRSALNGHNVLITGQAGTGKTFVVKEIVKALRDKGKSVSLTATTGIACCLYENASTIHRWSGIGDGRHDQSEIKKVIESNVQFAEVRDRITNTDVLIIDECSMLSKRMFECLSEVCKIKDTTSPFGGIQLVLIGDFTQLPPVPNQLYGEEGDFCFQSNLFDEIVPHRVTLIQVLRQTEKALTEAIHEIAIGNLTQESELFVKALNRPLSSDSIKLFARNEQVDEYNRNRILQFPGQLYEFQCQEEGDKKYLDKILAPKTLWIKIGAPVMLLRNLSDKLVNGLRGHVHGIDENGPVVEFPSIKEKLPLEKFKFSVFSPTRNTDVAQRFQYPIKLSFAITIHKSQGLTLDRLEVDCRQIFKPGQLGVALGRAKDTNGLRVINFSRSSVIPQPESVVQFLKKTSSQYQTDQSCCRSRALRAQVPLARDTGHFTVAELTEIEEAVELNEQPCDEEFDEEFDKIISMLAEEENENIELPADLNLEVIRKGIQYENVITPMQFSTNQILTEMDIGKYTNFCKTEFSKMSALISESNIDPAKPVTSKTQTEFYSKVHSYHTGTEFRMNCLKLFENMQFTENHLHICFNISNEIRKYLLKQKAALFPVANRMVSTRTLTNASEARVRYVGGYCIAKVKNSYAQSKKSSMYKVDEAGQAVFEESVVAVNILDSLRVEEHYLLATTDSPDSLLDVSRRQGKNRGLTNIPDDLFQFFKTLTEMCIKLFIDENMNKYGSSMFDQLQSTILQNEELFQMFCSVVDRCLAAAFEEAVQYEKQLVQAIYKKILKKYLMVMLNQFRRDVLESLNIQKQMAHRKQVRVASKGKGAKGKGPGKAKKTPASVTETEMEVSQETVTDMPEMESETEMADVSPGSSSGTKMADTVAETEKADVDPDTDMPETENITPETEDIEPCQICHLTQKESPSQTEWISCDNCKGWFHRKCAGLQHHLRWKKYQRPDVNYSCAQCRPT